VFGEDLTAESAGFGLEVEEEHLYGIAFAFLIARVLLRVRRADGCRGGAGPAFRFAGVVRFGYYLQPVAARDRVGRALSVS
ncbi:hypothetical protein, partial [Nocardia cyriacigeorgica]|uniref:hypothetical protein n=1 Tax=Nocardia cyriacigeorgica TaxID=135487 RepID=UPI002456CD0A